MMMSDLEREPINPTALTTPSEDASSLTPDSPPKNMTWRAAGLVIVADIVGVGVIGLPTAFARLGWIMGVLSIVFWFITNMKMGMLIREAVSYFPDSVSYLDLANKTFAYRLEMYEKMDEARAAEEAAQMRADVPLSNRAKVEKVARKYRKRVTSVMPSVIGVSVDVFLCGILSAYLIVLTETLKMMFPDGNLCQSTWTFLACLIVLPFTQFRLLGTTQILMAINVVTIFLAVATTFLYMFRMGATGRSDTTVLNFAEITFNGTAKWEMLASSLSVRSFFGAQGLIAFAFAGCFIYAEIISEMREGWREFDKALLWVSGPIQLGLYLGTALLGYTFLGDQSSRMIVLEIPPDSIEYQMSGAFLFCHMVFTYLIKSTILNRSIQRFILPNTVNDFKSYTSELAYVCIALVMLVIQFILANFLQFMNLLSLLGAVQTPFLGFLLPILFVYDARKRQAVPFPYWELVFLIFVGFLMWLLLIFGTIDALSNLTADPSSDPSSLAPAGLKC